MRAWTREYRFLILCSFLFALGPEATAWAAGKDLVGVINLNTAGPELLGLLPGVGPSKAKGIVAYRSRRPFRTVDELVRVKGIGRRMVRTLRPHLAIAGPTTARAVVGGSSSATETITPPASAPIKAAVTSAPSRLITRPTFLARLPRPSPPIRAPANHCEAPR